MPDDNAGTNAGGAPAQTDDLAGRLASQSALHDAMSPPSADGGEGSQEPPAPTPPPAGISKEDVQNILKESLEPLQQTITQQRMENANLRGQMNILARERPGASGTPATPSTPAPPRKSDAEWTTELQKNPTGALREFVGDLLKDAMSEIRGEITKTRQDVAGHVDQRERIRSAYTEEQTYCNTNFPVVKERADFNQEFFSDTEKAWTQIVQNENGQLRVGQLREAAQQVAVEWGRSGKNPWSRNAAPAGNTNGVQRPTEIRNVQRTNVQVNGNAAGGNRGNGKPTSIAELGLSASEQEAAREVVRRCGANGSFTEADFVRNYLAATEEVSNFGQG